MKSCWHYINNNLDAAFYKIPNYGISRLVKYSVNGRDYYLSTNIFDKNINYFKIMYHKRWENGFYFGKNKILISPLKFFYLKKSFREAVDLIF